MKMKKLLSVVLAAVLFAGVLGNASAAYAATSTKPSIKKTHYDGGGKVSVTFKKNVQYKSAKVTVTDPDGKKLTAKVSSKDKSELEFKVSKLKTNGKYKFKISGIKVKNARSYTSVSGSFKVDDQKNSSKKEDAKKVSIKDVVYDAKDKELHVTFNVSVKFKDAKVTVKDSSGKKLSAKIEDTGSKSMDIYVSKLKNYKKNTKFTVKISGVRNRDGGEYQTVSGTYKFYD